MSQMALTDVLGHAMVLIWSCRLLLHEVRSAEGREDPRSRGHQLRILLGWGFTGFLATYAILVRLSSALFFFLFAFLAVRALLANRERSLRIQKGGSLLLGGLLPVALVFGHLIHQLGWHAFATSYFKISSDNAGLRQTLSVVVERWISHLQLGSHHLLFWAGASGAALFLLAGLHRSSLRVFRGRRTLFCIAFLLSLPYLAAVARNRAWYEFRYMVPAFAFLSLGMLAWAWLVDRFLGARATLALTLAVLALQILAAWPWLHAFGTRTNYSEAVARELAERVPDGSFVFAHLAGAHIEYRSEKRFGLIGVRHTDAEEGPDFWNRTWSQARREMRNALTNGRAVYCVDEESLEPFRADLVERGWRQELVATRAFDGLRNAHDGNLATMKIEMALRPRPIRVLRLDAPAGRVEAPALLAARATSGDDSDLVFDLTAAEGAGMAWRAILHEPSQPTWLHLPGQLMLPTSLADELFVLSADPNADTAPDLAFLRGRLDADGHAVIRIPHRHRDTIRGKILTILVHDPAEWWQDARIRSPGVKIP
jgi:hypothetical protein